MMCFKDVRFLSVLIIINLFVPFTILEAKKTKSAKVVNWILEDPSPDNGWDFCVTWQGQGDIIKTAGDYKNILVSKKEFHKGKTSLKLDIRHAKNGYCGVWLSTGPGNKGIPAGSWDEANIGKDISNCDTLEFWIKGTGKAKVKNIKIEIEDTKQKKTDKLILADYMKPGKNWKKVQISLEEFSWSKGFNKKSVKGIAFIIEQNIPSGEYILYIDDFRFIKKGIKPKIKKRFKLIFEDVSVEDGAWNFSGTWNGNGSTIEKTKKDKNMPISTKEKYKGFNCFKFHVKQKKGGWAGCWFSGNRTGNGLPPENWEDYDTPKDLSDFNAIRLWVKGKGRANGKLELGDVNKNSTGKIDLSKYINITDKWQEIIVPYKDIKWQNFEIIRFKEFKLMIDDDHPEGEFTLYIDNLEFIKQ